MLALLLWSLLSESLLNCFVLRRWQCTSEKLQEESVFSGRWWEVMFSWKSVRRLEVGWSSPYFSKRRSSRFHELQHIVVVQLLSLVWLFVSPCLQHARLPCPSLSYTIFWSLHKLMSIESVMSSNHLILCHPLLFLPSVLLSIRVFSSELDLCIR